MENAWPQVPEWVLAAQVGPLLTSLEIGLEIVDESLDEVRTRPHLNHAAKAQAVATSVCALMQLIAEVADADRASASLPEALLGPASRGSAWRGVMKKLPRVAGGRRLEAGLRSERALVARALGFDLGLSEMPGQRCFDWDRWVRPTAVHGLYAPDRRERYVEDPIFVRVHQTCEGIMEAMLVELDRAEKALFQADYGSAERRILMASRFERPLERTMSVLGEMSQLDYAPLRVALRDASGVQSERANARKTVARDLFWLFSQQLRHRGLDCFTVLANPIEHKGAYRLLQAFKVLGRNINETMSSHAHLVQNVLGSTVIGTAGFRIMSLGEVAALPLLPDLASALDTLTLWTNLQYADHSGVVIREQEEEHRAADRYEFFFPDRPCDHALMAATVDRYFEAIRDRRKGDWTALFADSPHFEDPTGTKPYVTEWNLDVFFRNFQKLFPKVLATSHTIVEQGDNHLRVQWRISAASFLGGMEVGFRGIETFYFDPEGRIAVAFAEWRPDRLAEEMMERHRASLRDASTRSPAPNDFG